MRAFLIMQELKLIKPLLTREELIFNCSKRDHDENSHLIGFAVPLISGFIEIIAKNTDIDCQDRFDKLPMIFDRKER